MWAVLTPTSNSMLSGEELTRRERLVQLREKGVDPYPSTTNRTHTVADALAQFSDLETSQAPLTIAGRVLALRQMGGLTFVRVLDGSGAMQAVVKSDDMGEEAYAVFTSFADIGDIYEFTGTAFVTKKGEQSVLASAARLLSKALSPLPEKWHGLSDVETRYRQRELDLISNPDVRERLVTRSRIVAAIRHFLDDRGFLEVETPMLQPIPGGASARPFITHHNALDADLYLRIAPELYLKRLLVGGFEKIYEIGRCFRNEGIDYSHNPEFTMLELYWAFADVEAFITLLEGLVTHAASIAGDEAKTMFVPPFPRVTFREAIINACGIDIDTVQTPEAITAAAKDANVRVDFNGCYGMGEFYDTLWKATARPGITTPTWVFDYPVDLKPLAKARAEDPTKSACVQLVIEGAEVINAYYNELNDPLDQRARFEEQQTLREKGSEEAQWMDEEFLSALEHAMPPTSGVGIGIDRLVAFLTKADNLKEVILFPTLKPKKAKQSPGKKATDVFAAINDVLTSKNVTYVTKKHGDKPEDSDAAMGFDPSKRPHHEGAKAIIVKGKKSGSYFHFVLPDDCKLDQKKVAAIIGERFSFASAEEVVAVTGCVPGSVPPFGSVLGLTTHVDGRLKENQEIFFNAGSLTDSIRMQLADYLSAEPHEDVDATETV